MRILLVEDEEYMAQAVAQVLEKNNYTVDLAHDGEYGLDCALSGIYDIIILDIMLPGHSGLEILRTLRQEKITVPILLLTAKSETEDKVTGLDSGADDYLTKPFEMQELLARLRVLARRKQEIISQNNCVFGDIVLNPHTLSLYCGSDSFKLTLKESQLLEMLISARGGVISKSRIIEKVWGFDSEAEDRHVEVYISFLRKKLKHRFIFTNMAMLSAVLLLSFAVIYLITAYQMQNQNQLKLENIHSTTLRYQEANERNDSFQMVGTSQGYADAFGVIVDEENQVVFDSSFGLLSRGWITQAIEQTNGRKEGQIVLEGRRFLFSKIPAYAKVNSALEDAAIEQFSQIAFLDITASKQSLLELLAAFVGIGLLTLMAMLGISILFAKRAVAPIEQSYRKQKQFVQDTSHELKTPLASIRANLEALQASKQETIQSQEKWLNHISHETLRMNKLVTELLELARADQTEQAITLESICLSKLLEKALPSVEAMLYEKEISLQEEIEPDIYANANTGKAEQVVRILLDNACKYTDSGGTVAIRLYRQRKYALLTVSNTGKGIPEEHMDKIFDRFYRVDVSRKHTGSYGLGLPIAKSLMGQMNGNISVSSTPNSITTFTVRWNLS